MTKEEYIRSLIDKNVPGNIMNELVKQWEIDNPQTEEVVEEVVEEGKQNDSQPEGADVDQDNVAPQEASESLDGKSLSDEDKATAAAEAKEKENRINSLYSKYNEDGDQDVSVEDKEKWLKENKQQEEDVSKLSWWQKRNIFWRD